MFPTKAAKRLVSIPMRAGSSIKFSRHRRRLKAKGDREPDPSDEILAEFEASAVDLNRAAGRYRRAKSDLKRSNEGRQVVVTGCEEIVDQAIAKLGVDQEEDSPDPQAEA